MKNHIASLALRAVALLGLGLLAWSASLLPAYADDPTPPTDAYPSWCSVMYGSDVGDCTAMVGPLNGQAATLYDDNHVEFGFPPGCTYQLTEDTSIKLDGIDSWWTYGAAHEWLVLELHEAGQDWHPCYQASILDNQWDWGNGTGLDVCRVDNIDKIRIDAENIVWQRPPESEHPFYRADTIKLENVVPLSESCLGTTPTPTSTSTVPALPAATATPTPNTVIIFLSTQACAPYQATSTRTPQVTPTRLDRTPQPTPTASATRTGTPPTPVPTSTNVGPSFDGGLTTFDQSLSPWTAGDVGLSWDITPTIWSSAVGPNGQPGVAQIGGGVNYTDFPYTYTHDSDYFALTGSWGQPVGIVDALVFSQPAGFLSPVHISGQARFSRPILLDVPVYLIIYYYDINYTGTFLDRTAGDWIPTTITATTPMWISPPSTYNHQRYIPVSPNWNYFDFEFSVPTGHKVTAVAIGWVTKNGDNPTDGVVLVDNLRVTAGNDLKLPACSTSSIPVGPGGPTSIPLKYCPINYRDIDVMSACIRPTSWTDFGNWISWGWCRAWRYFAFLPDNRRQIEALQSRQNVNEPIGSVLEMQPIVVDFTNTLAEMQARNRPQPKSPLDFVNLFDASALDNPAALFNFDILHPPSIDYLSECPSDIVSQGNRFSSGACMGIAAMRNTIIVLLMQWLLDAVFIIGVLKYVYKIIKDVAG